MKNLITKPQIMSSREIAEITGKEHRSVMRDIRTMFEQMEISTDLCRSFEGTFIDNMNREKSCYNLPRRECEILITGYDIKRRAAVIDRWFALEIKLKELQNQEQQRIQARETARLEYKPMNDVLVQSRKELGKDTTIYHYCNEANLINRIVLGSTSNKYCMANAIEQKVLRDNLDPTQIKAILHMQRLNTSLLEIGMSYYERKDKLIEVFSKNYKHMLVAK